MATLPAAAANARARRAARRVLLAVVILELSVLAVRFLESAGFNSKLAVAVVVAFTVNLFACWFFVARAAGTGSRRTYRR
jgi:hypothetical protein